MLFHCGKQISAEPQCAILKLLWFKRYGVWRNYDRCRGWTLLNCVPVGHFLFACSDTFVLGCIVSHKAQRHRQTGGQTTVSCQQPITITVTAVGSDKNYLYSGMQFYLLYIVQRFCPTVMPFICLAWIIMFVISFNKDAIVLRGWRLPSRTWNHWTSAWTKQLTWLRIVHSGEWCLRLALRTRSGA